jgi:predicted transposase/invertase (TIGR01784 family)
MQKKIDWINGDPTLLRSYLRYAKAESDEITRINGARREGRQEGRQEGRLEIAAKMKKRGLPLDQIAEDTGLTVEEIKRL